VYEVEFPDGTIAKHAANVLAEALYTQVDTDDNWFLLLKEIIDHMKDETAASTNDEPIHNTNGSRNSSKHITTKGCKFQCLRADGSSSWEPLWNLKDANPIELAEYGEAHNLLKEPAFAWWAKDILQQKK
jgi:hypothetical protein